ncbi:MAG TPA: hypothetical protein VJ921_04740, partial [Vicinamibacteria bacterium]|nr:hypothetical protein [Vicinamibacteria bacterium]
MRRRRSSHLLLASLAVLFAADTLWAQSSPFETVYFAQPNNRILKVVEFQLPHGPGSAETVVVEPGNFFQGLVVRQDTLIFVASKTHKGSIQVCDPESGACNDVIALKEAEGLDISTMTGSLVAVSDDEDLIKLDPTGCAQTFESPGCRAGGYQTAFQKRKVPGVKDFVDVKFARITKGPFSQGDVALLSRNPAKLLKLTHFGAAPTTVLSQIKFNGKKLTPTGLAFNSAGDALISTFEGLLLRYPGGNGAPQLFANLGGFGAKLAVGVQGENLQERIFATVRPGRVHCYESSGASCGKVAGLVLPEGIGIATGAFQATPTGDNVSQILNLGLRTEWEEIVQNGASVALCRQFSEIRPPGSLDPLYLCDPAKTYEGFACAAGSAPFVDLALPNVIPAHVRAFRTGTDAHNPSGPETFQVCVMNTSAGFRGIIRDHVGIPLDLTEHATTWIGYDFHELCPAPAVYWSPSPGERAGVEGFEFTDVTLACNHPLGGSWSRSSIITGAYTTMTPCEEAEFKLGNIDETLSLANIAGSCDVGSPVSGGVPDGATAASMDAAFSLAGLGPRSGWSLLSGDKGAFGAGGNGFLVGGGSVEVEAKDAGFNHELGIASVSHGDLTPILANSGAPPPAVPPFSAGEKYLFYFQNIDGAPLLTPIFSDGTSASGQLGIAVYQSNADPTRFALFFDDGGGAPDADFND